MGVPSSRTSMIAIFDGGVEASRFELLWERRICESSVEDRRGSVATVCIAILRINALWSFSQSSSGAKDDGKIVVRIRGWKLEVD